MLAQARATLSCVPRAHVPTGACSLRPGHPNGAGPRGVRRAGGPSVWLPEDLLTRRRAHRAGSWEPRATFRGASREVSLLPLWAANLVHIPSLCCLDRDVLSLPSTLSGRLSGSPGFSASDRRLSPRQLAELLQETRPAPEIPNRSNSRCLAGPVPSASPADPARIPRR